DPPAPASGSIQPKRGPKFRHYTDADRERIMKERRLARDEERRSPPKSEREYAVARPIGNFPQRSADRDSALASAFNHSTEIQPRSIQEWSLPSDSGPLLAAPTV